MLWKMRGITLFSGLTEVRDQVIIKFRQLITAF